MTLTPTWTPSTANPPIKMPQPLDTEHTDSIVCPHCGYEDLDSSEVDFGPGLEGETEHECADCGQRMTVERHCAVSYTTAKVENVDPK